MFRQDVPSCNQHWVIPTMTGRKAKCRTFSKGYVGVDFLGTRGPKGSAWVKPENRKISKRNAYRQFDRLWEGFSSLNFVFSYGIYLSFLLLIARCDVVLYARQIFQAMDRFDLRAWHGTGCLTWHRVACRNGVAKGKGTNHSGLLLKRSASRSA